MYITCQLVVCAKDRRHGWEIRCVLRCCEHIHAGTPRFFLSDITHSGIVQNKAMAAANAQAVETLGAIHTVQSNVAEAKEIDTLTDKFNFFLRIIKFTVYSETVTPRRVFGPVTPSCRYFA